MADDTTDQTDDQQQSDTTDQTDDDAQLGDAGKRALADERNARKRAERDAKTTKAELDRIRAEGQTETEKAIAKAKAEGANEALTKANERVLKAEVKAAAAGKLTDPADAARFLDLSEFTVGDDGDVDSKALGQAIDRLLKERPYLGNGGGKRPVGGADGGARSNGAVNTPDMNAWLRGERVSL
jgi:membrane protein involved in colicin uptake